MNNNHQKGTFQTSKNQFLSSFSQRQQQIKNNSKSKKQMKMKDLLNQKFNAENEKKSKWKKQVLKKDDSKFVQIYQPPKPEIQRAFNQYKRACLQKRILPGPGQYNISIPIIKPNYQTLHKNDQILLVKINNNGGTANFKNNKNRFDYSYNQQNLYTPGPGQYQTIDTQRKNMKDQDHHYHANYDAIRQVYYQHYQKIDSIPNITIQRTSNNSHYCGKPRKMQQFQAQLKQKYNQKQTIERIKLLNNAKSLNSSLKSLWSHQEQKQSKKSIFQDKSAFPIRKDQDQVLRQKQQVSGQKKIMLQTMQKISKQIQIQRGNHLKIKQLFGIRKHSLKQKMQLHRNYGYYNGNQSQKLDYQKYNVKLDLNKQELKTILAKQKKYQTLETKTIEQKFKFKNEKEKHKNYPNSISLNLRQNIQKYNRNMLDIISMTRQNKNIKILNNNNKLYQQSIQNQQVHLHEQIVIQGRKRSLKSSQINQNQRYASIQQR